MRQGNPDSQDTRRDGKPTENGRQSKKRQSELSRSQEQAIERFVGNH